MGPVASPARPIGDLNADEIATLGGLGNFGDGRINAIDSATGDYVGQLRDANNRPITIDGLWAIAFGGGGTGSNGPTNSLFFTAGPNGESGGLFGTIRAAP